MQREERAIHHDAFAYFEGAVVLAFSWGLGFRVLGLGFRVTRFRVTRS